VDQGQTFTTALYKETLEEAGIEVEAFQYGGEVSKFLLDTDGEQLTIYRNIIHVVLVPLTIAIANEVRPKGLAEDSLTGVYKWVSYDVLINLLQEKPINSIREEDFKKIWGRK
jgi:8-oxo-dGTP pyrophosphatase MutT (NUDIX family)